MAHKEQFTDEDRGMRITCFVLCAIVISICIGVLLYVMFL